MHDPFQPPPVIARPLPDDDGGPAASDCEHRAHRHDRSTCGAPAPKQSPRTKHGATILLLSLTSVATSASMRLCDALQPRIGTELAIGTDRVAMLIVGFSLAYGVAQIAWGMVGERFDRLRVIAAANALAACGAGLCASAPGFGTLLGGRILAGATCAAVIPLSMAWIGDNVPFERRQPIIARFTLGQVFGVAAGQWIGGFAAEHLPWRLPFWWLAAWFLAGSALLWQAARSRGAVAPAHGAPGGRGGPLLAQIGTTLGMPRARRVVLAGLLEGAAIYGALAFIAVHLNRTLGMSLSAAGASTMLFGVGGLVYVGAAHVLVRRLGTRGLCVAGGSLIAVALAILGILPGPWAGAMIFVLGLGYYMLHNTLQVQSTQVNPASRGIGVSLFTTAFFLGQALGVSLMARLAALASLGSLIAAFGIVALLVGLLAAPAVLPAKRSGGG